MYETILTQVDGFSDAWLIKLKDKYYVVSAVDNMWAYETLVFESNELGKPVDLEAVAGGKYYDHSAAIVDLISQVGEE